MNKSYLLFAAMWLAPMAANALPAIGDIIGANKADATAALAKAGCTVTTFEAEDGKVEGVCTDTATGKLVEIVIDPKTGAVTEIKRGD